MVASSWSIPAGDFEQGSDAVPGKRVEVQGPAARVRTSAARPDNSAQLWLSEVRDPAITVEQLSDRGTFYSLDSMISSAMDEIVTGLLKQEFQLLEIQLNITGQSLAGRVKLRMLCDQFSITKEAAQDSAVRAISTTALMNGFQGIRAFLASWDEIVLIGGSAITEHQLRTHFYAQICKIDEFKFDAMLYDRLPPNHPNKNYASLRTAVDSVVEHRRQTAMELELVPGRRVMPAAAAPILVDPKPPPPKSNPKLTQAAAAVAKPKGKFQGGVRASSVPRTAAEKALLPCYNFRDGKCTLGQSCSYSHSNLNPKAKPAATRPPAKASTAKPSRAGSSPHGGDQICYDFQSSRGCTRHNCKFKHIAKAAVGAIIQG